MLNIDSCCKKDITTLTDFEKSILTTLDRYWDSISKMLEKAIRDEVFGHKKNIMYHYNEMMIMNAFIDYLFLLNEKVLNDEYGFDNLIIDSERDIMDFIEEHCLNHFVKYFSKYNYIYEI